LIVSRRIRTARRFYGCDLHRRDCQGIKAGSPYVYVTEPPGGEFGNTGWMSYRACTPCVEFDRDMGYDYISNRYGVAAFHGAEVSYELHPGTLVGTESGHLLILLDGREKPIQVHPRDDGLVYLVAREEATA
jgi:hypothetical protein